MTTTLKLKFIRETPLARLYADHKDRQQWIPRSICPKTLKLGDIHEVAIETWWLEANPFEKKPQPQSELQL